ncbi:MAG: recombinase family protein [Myxococcales bacterium]|nr:recombinase family protein [Myxococcales bacterium]
MSTDMQVQHGLSLDAQREEIKQCAADRGWIIEEIFVDGGFSAKNTDRPAFQRMTKAIKDADGAIAAVLVTKLDRLTRSLRDLCNINEDLLEPYGCNLVAIRDGINTFEPVSKMLLPFLAIIGQIERQNTGERVKATIKHIHDQGGHYGKVPFGFSTVKDGKLSKLVPDPVTHPWLEKAIGWYREGVTMTEIARRLNEEGIKPRYGAVKEWNTNKIYELLRTMGIHKTRAIVSESIYDKRAAYKLAYQLRGEGKTYTEIADALNAAGLRPLKAAAFRWYSAQELLRSAVFHDRGTARGLALYLKEQGHSLREIGLRLAQAGHFPKRGGQWYPNTVRLLMVS